MNAVVAIFFARCAPRAPNACSSLDTILMLGFCATLC